MRIDIRAMGLATGLTVASVSALCRLAFLVAPGAAMDAANFLVHSDYSGVTRAPTAASFVGGVLGWGTLAGLLGAGAAWLYNRLVVRTPLVA